MKTRSGADTNEAPKGGRAWHSALPKLHIKKSKHSSSHILKKRQAEKLVLSTNFPHFFQESLPSNPPTNPLCPKKNMPCSTIPTAAGAKNAAAGAGASAAATGSGAAGAAGAGAGGATGGAGAAACRSGMDFFHNTLRKDTEMFKDKI
jgi:hypothetical protein